MTARAQKLIRVQSFKYALAPYVCTLSLTFEQKKER